MHICCKINKDTPNGIQWAIAFAGAVASAKEKKNVNPPFQFSLISDIPELNPLVEALDKPSNDMEEIRIPDTMEMEELDIIGARKMRIELEEIHGIPADDIPISNLPATNIASLIMLMQFSIVSNPKFYFPLLGKGVWMKFAGTNGVYWKEEYKEPLLNFLNGLGIKNPNIINLEQLPIEDRLAILNSPLDCVAIPYNSPYISIMRAYYKGFDFMSEFPPILSMVDEEVQGSRFLLAWGATLLCDIREPIESFKKRGEIWAKRKSVGFDRHKMFKLEAQNYIIQNKNSVLNWLVGKK